MSVSRWGGCIWRGLGTGLTSTAAAATDLWFAVTAAVTREAVGMVRPYVRTLQLKSPEDLQLQLRPAKSAQGQHLRDICINGSNVQEMRRRGLLTLAAFHLQL